MPHSFVWSRKRGIITSPSLSCVHPFSPFGRRVGESNVLHVGPPLAFSLEITHAGPDDGARDPARAGAFKWRDTEQTSVAFTATMAEWAKAAEIDAVIFLLNNQTHGMMRLGEAGLLNHQGTSCLWSNRAAHATIKTWCCLTTSRPARRD